MVNIPESLMHGMGKYPDGFAPQNFHGWEEHHSWRYLFKRRMWTSMHIYFIQLTNSWKWWVAAASAQTEPNLYKEAYSLLANCSQAKAELDIHPRKITINGKNKSSMMAENKVSSVAVGAHMQLTWQSCGLALWQASVGLPHSVQIIS